MLRKLLKYDLDAVWRIWLPLAVSVPVMALITSLFIRAMVEETFSPEGLIAVMLGLMLTFTVMALVILWVGLFITTPLLCYTHFYKHFFTDRGYLTFTLPVPRRDLYLSKVVNAFIWSVGNVLVTLLSAGILLLLLPTSEEVTQFINPVLFEVLGSSFQFLWSNVGAWLIVYILEILLLLVIVSLCNIGLFHLAITAGSVIAKKRKALCAVGIYLGINYGISFVAQFFLIFLASPLASFSYMLSQLPLQRQCGVLAVGLLIVMLVLSILAAIYHFVALHLIERKLNLS